ncbi:MAG TPA: 3-phosphoshikimate 1-carboxyvinyltransferase [Cyclobacteriaceae bacterium]|nr:3-phosphoshikimate 1-carboxyvinyltransferase [Cyclobacteriaceae bacterium]
MEPLLHLTYHPHLRGIVQSLPSSKSLSNRALIIHALSDNTSKLENLSSARDTQLMLSLIHNPEKVINVMDAGTTMRFLTAYFGATRQSKILTGTDRMKERPIHLLVNALRSLGVTIQYLGKEGFPPLEVMGFEQQLTDRLSIRGDVSSQFISALMMVAPTLPLGLTIRLEGKIGSMPYLRMTAALMKQFGVNPTFQGADIIIPAKAYTATNYRVEPDWSAASYWFAFAALATEAQLLLPGVGAEALQGDRVIVDIMSQLGVSARFGSDGMTLTKQPVKVQKLEWDFTDCPDLAQTVLPVCTALRIPGSFTGLESLRIKETDRIDALQQELGKIGGQLEEVSGRWTLLPSPIPSAKPVINTYHDHRMAMGFAPLLTTRDISIGTPEVVQKSYPTFWSDLRALGVKMEEK